jgi:hypothetical protein
VGLALQGMRVRLSIQALKARHSKAQGASPGNGMRSNQPCKGGTGFPKKKPVPPLQGWFQNLPDPGFHPGLCCCALSALGFIFSSLEAYSQQSRSKKHAALAGTAALPANRKIRMPVPRFSTLKTMVMRENQKSSIFAPVSY